MSTATTLPEPTSKPTTLFDAHALVEEKLQHPVHLLELFTDTEPGALWDADGGPNLTPEGWALVRTVCDLLGDATEALWECVWGTVPDDDAREYLWRVAETVALCSAAVVACRVDDTAGLIGVKTNIVLRRVHERLWPLYIQAVEA